MFKTIPALIAAATLGLTVGIVGCEESPEDSLEDAAENVEDAAESAADETGEAIEDATDGLNP